MSPPTRRNLEILLPRRGVNYSFAMIDLPPVDDREGGDLVPCTEKLTDKPADAAGLFQATGSAATTGR